MGGVPRVTGSIRINGWMDCVFLSVTVSQCPDKNSGEVPVIFAPALGKLLLCSLKDPTVDFIDALRGCCCTDVEVNPPTTTTHTHAPQSAVNGYDV